MKKGQRSSRPTTHVVQLPAEMLHRGFWLYVWRVTVDRSQVLYVGRTGDNSSPFAVPPYQRMGQHLGNTKTQNALRQHLKKLGYDPTDCRHFDFICHGPIHPEVTGDNERSDLMARHLPLRNSAGALEKRLAEGLKKAGYRVLNKVSWSHDHDPLLWRSVAKAFRAHFPKLAED